MSVNDSTGISTTQSGSAQAAGLFDPSNSSVKEEEIDPFTYRPQITKWDYLKFSINALWLFPLRLFFVVIPSIIVGIFVCLMALLCDKYNEDDLQPLNRWGRFVMGYIGTFVTRVFLLGFGFNWIRTRGKQVPTKEAPILVVSPHSCLLDIFVISIYTKFPTFIARSGVRHIPLIGFLITRTMRTIYVERQDPDSRMKAAEEIRRRTHTRGEWPKVLIFAEGTTTNTKAVISFKQGAFLPRLPVQPVLIKYKNKLNTTTWGEDGLGLLGSLFLTMCQFHNSLEVEFLPVYNPSDEEMNQPRLFARNVQVVMAETMGVPYTNHAFEDVLLMRSAHKAGLPFRSGMVVYQKANRDLSMDLSTMKKWLHRFIAMDSDKDGLISMDDFARFLLVPSDAQLQAVFDTAELKDGRLSYRRYLYDILGKANRLILDASFMQAMFNFFDSDGDGIVSEADLSAHIPINSLHDVDHLHSDHPKKKQQGQSKQRDDMLLSNDASDEDQVASIPAKMNLDQFTSLLDNHPEYALIFYTSHHGHEHSSVPLMAEAEAIVQPVSQGLPHATVRQTTVTIEIEESCD